MVVTDIDWSLKKTQTKVERLIFEKDIAIKFSWPRMQTPETDTFRDLLTASQMIDYNAHWQL